MRSPLKIFEDAIETAAALIRLHPLTQFFKHSCGVPEAVHPVDPVDPVDVHQVGTLVRPFVEPELGFDIYSRTSALVRCSCEMYFT